MEAPGPPNTIFCLFCRATIYFPGLPATRRVSRDKISVKMLFYCPGTPITCFLSTILCTRFRLSSTGRCEYQPWYYSVTLAHCNCTVPASRKTFIHFNYVYTDFYLRWIMWLSNFWELEEQSTKYPIFTAWNFLFPPFLNNVQCKDIQHQFCFTMNDSLTYTHSAQSSAA